MAGAGRLPSLTPGNFAIALQKIYYGWWNVGIGMLGMALAPAVIAFYTMGIYIPVLSEDLGWTRTQITATVSISGITSVICTPFIGRFVDAMGVKRVLVVALGVFAMTFASFFFLGVSLLHFYAAFVLIGAAVPVTTLCFSRTAVTWFDRRRGIALGLTTAGTGVGAMLIPALTQFLISTIGWRLTYLALGLMTGVIVIPLVALFLRDRPTVEEKMLDARTPPGDSKMIDDYGTSTGEAIRTAVFWKLIVVFFMVSLSLQAIVVHLVPILIDAGLSAKIAAAYMSVFGASFIVGRIACGYAIDRVFAPWVGCGLFLASALAALLLLVLEPGSFLPALIAFLFGFGVGSELDLLGYLVARYFGLRHYGVLYGYVFSAFLLGTSFGPLFLGIIYDTLGAYHSGLVMIAAALCFSAIIIVNLGKFPEWTTPADS